jgi:hypothetical protein
MKAEIRPGACTFYPGVICASFWLYRGVVPVCGMFRDPEKCTWKDEWKATK